MKAKVINQYRDKETKKSHKIGQFIEVSQNRFDEINSTAFGVFLEVIEKPPVEDKPSKEPLDIIESPEEPQVEEVLSEEPLDNIEPPVEPQVEEESPKEALVKIEPAVEPLTDIKPPIAESKSKAANK